MEKIFYIENNRIKLIRNIIEYTEDTKTDTLEMTKKIKQYLNTNKDLEELEKRLIRKGVKYDVSKQDVSEYEVYENKIVGSLEDAIELMNINN